MRVRTLIWKREDCNVAIADEVMYAGWSEKCSRGGVYGVIDAGL